MVVEVTEGHEEKLKRSCGTTLEPTDELDHCLEKKTGTSLGSKISKRNSMKKRHSTTKINKSWPFLWWKKLKNLVSTKSSVLNYDKMRTLYYTYKFFKHIFISIFAHFWLFYG